MHCFIYLSMKITKKDNIYRDFGFNFQKGNCDVIDTCSTFSRNLHKTERKIPISIWWVFFKLKTVSAAVAHDKYHIICYQIQTLISLWATAVDSFLSLKISTKMCHFSLLLTKFLK